MVSCPASAFKFRSDAQIRDQTRIIWLRQQFSTVFSLAPEPADLPDENLHVSSKCCRNGAKDLVQLMNKPVHAGKKISTICIEYVRMKNAFYENIIVGHIKQAGKSLIDFILELQRAKKLRDYCRLCFARYHTVGYRWKALLDEFRSRLTCDIEFVTREANPLCVAGDETQVDATYQFTTSGINYADELRLLVQPYEGPEPFCRITIKPVTASIIEIPLNELKTKRILVAQKKEKQPKTTRRKARPIKRRKRQHEQSSTRRAKNRRSVISSPTTTVSTYVRLARGLTCCACGNTSCNTVSKFLGPPVVNRKLCYKRPSQFKDPRITYSHENKFKRAEIIDHQMRKWRKKFNNEWPLSTSVRFNEIHYPRQFLHAFGECTRLPMTIPISLAKQVGMFREEYIVYNPRLKLHSVLVVPCLTAFGAMSDAINSRYSQVSEVISGCLCFACLRTSPEVVSKIGDCGPQRCLQPFHNAIVERNVFVWPSKIHNYGLFAVKRMDKGDIICLYSGSLHEKIASLTNTSRYVCEVEQNNKTYVIDANDVLNYSGRWCNHSFYPNACLVTPAGGMIKLSTGKYAILVECERTINKHDEIFIDYGRKYFTVEKEDGKKKVERAYFTHMLRYLYSPYH